MGKNSSYERRPRDAYFTPYDAVLPLLTHIRGSFIEPCAGDGRLIRHLKEHGLICKYACDIEPQAEGIEKLDVIMLGAKLPPCEQIITNPPWSRPSLHAMIEKFRLHAPTWLLIDAGWAYTKQAKPHLNFCHKIVPIGRLKWLENTSMTAKEDAAWYYFSNKENSGFLEFITH